MEFVGKDFLKMKPPAGYVPGVGRGAVGFSTNAERGGTFPSSNSANRKSNKPEIQDPSRFEDAEEEEADRIYEAIEAKRRRKGNKKGTRTKELSDNHNQPVDDPVSSESKNLSSISLSEWAQLPEASDNTRWNKRLRESEQRTRRMYAAPNEVRMETEDTETTKLHESMRPILEAMIKQQPLNEEGYLRLARLEEQGLHLKRARQLVERGTLKIPQSAKLWLASIELHPHSSEARQVAAKACRTLPQCEQLWLKAVSLEPTKAMKQQVVHEALLACPRSEELWLLAASLEQDTQVKIKVLVTAKEFVDTPAIWISLCELESSHFVEARNRFPNDKNVWFASIKHDERLVSEAVKALPRDQWLLFISSLPPDSSLLAALVRELMISLDEAKSLPSDLKHAVFEGMEPSEDLFLEWSNSSPEILDKATTLFPESDRLWLRYYEQWVSGSNKQDSKTIPDAWSKLLSVNQTSSVPLLTKIATLLLGSGEFEKAIAWLEPVKTKSVELWLMLIRASTRTSPDSIPQLVDEGLKTWPDCADLYILKAARISSVPTKVQVLREAIQYTAGNGQAALWNSLAEHESASTKRRALLAQAIAKHPHFGPLWLSRIQLEKQEKKPISFTLSEALRKCPDYAPLWLEDLLATPPNQRKRRLAEAVRQSKGNPEVLGYGAMYFAANKNMEVAREWLKRAGKTDETELITNNPFRA